MYIRYRDKLAFHRIGLNGLTPGQRYQSTESTESRIPSDKLFSKLYKKSSYANGFFGGNLNIGHSEKGINQVESKGNGPVNSFIDPEFLEAMKQRNEKYGSRELVNPFITCFSPMNELQIALFPQNYLWDVDFAIDGKPVPIQQTPRWEREAKYLARETKKSMRKLNARLDKIHSNLDSSTVSINKGARQQIEELIEGKYNGSLTKDALSTVCQTLTSSSGSTSRYKVKKKRQ